jgi:uncharacterized damage-inducible protein DinB
MPSQAQQHPDMWLDPEDDPRQVQDSGPKDELGTLLDYLAQYRLTLALKCEGLDAEQLARRSVPPSTLSLLGLVRHMAHVERSWFKVVLDGQHDLARLFPGDGDPAFDGAVGEDEAVDQAFRLWREEIAFAEGWVREHPDPGLVVHSPRHGDLNVRDVLVHMVEEYARHCGHADLLRECIDGRTGQ